MTTRFVNISNKLLFSSIATLGLYAGSVWANQGETLPRNWDIPSQKTTQNSRFQCVGYFEFSSGGNGGPVRGYGYGYGQTREDALSDLKDRNGGRLLSVVNCKENT